MFIRKIIIPIKKMVKIRFVDLFETNNFVSYNIFLYVAKFVRNIKFFISRLKQKPCVLSKNGQNEDSRFI